MPLLVSAEHFPLHTAPTTHSNKMSEFYVACEAKSRAKKRIQSSLDHLMREECPQRSIRERIHVNVNVLY